MKIESIGTKDIHICPNGCGRGFITSAHVAQDWKVDGDGDYIECISDCTETVAPPDIGNTWTCCECGAEAAHYMNTRRYKIFPNCNEAEPGKRRGADLYVCSEGVFYRRENDLSATCLAPTEDDIYDVPDIGKVRIDLTREAGQEITPVAENAKKSAAASKLQAFFGRFVSGENLDGIIDQRVRETLLCRGEGTRDESDFHITLVFNGADADAFNKKVAELYEKYDTEHDCEPDSATEGWSENFELETVVSLGVMNEIFAQAEDFGGFKAKSAIAIYDGVFFFSETSEAIFQGQAS